MKRMEVMSYTAMLFELEICGAVVWLAVASVRLRYRMTRMEVRPAVVNDFDPIIWKASWFAETEGWAR